MPKSMALNTRMRVENIHSNIQYYCSIMHTYLVGLNQVPGPHLGLLVADELVWLLDPADPDSLWLLGPADPDSLWLLDPADPDSLWLLGPADPGCCSEC